MIKSTAYHDLLFNRGLLHISYSSTGGGGQSGRERNIYLRALEYSYAVKSPRYFREKSLII